MRRERSERKKLAPAGAAVGAVLAIWLSSLSGLWTVMLWAGGGAVVGFLGGTLIDGFLDSSRR